ncbi:MAG: four helix bundle protein [Verrucomicrobia bacterium]|nr:four helix bundle protein [Verrucomicrobiota bacterium]
MSDINTLEELACYRLAQEHRRQISRFCKTLPVHEEYRLKDELLRSSRAVSRQIADGFGRRETRENLRLCRRARGSLMETLDNLGVASDEGYMAEETYAAMCVRLQDAWNVLNGYITYLEQRVREGLTFTDREYEN